MTTKWPRGGPIAEQPVRIAGSDMVPASAVADLLARCGEALVPDYMPELAAGTRVRILRDGVFHGYEGTIGELENGCRVVDTGTIRIRVRDHELAPATVERSQNVPLSQ